MAKLHIFGIRHHGPGSARSLRQALEALRPDAVLIEGPPEAAAVLPLAAHAEMQPPVALLVYRPDEPQRAGYHPFAVFSPEWQAIRYALDHGITPQFMDLPQSHQLALPPDGMPEQPLAQLPPGDPSSDTPEIRADPLGWLAEAAGFSDGERWWEHMVEQRQDSTGVFEAVLEAMAALRQAMQTEPLSEREAQREAYMRQTIRAAQHDGRERIAVVCGAWHAPALAEMPPAKHDATLLRGLPKTKVVATWIPWTNGRLSVASGYGAGILSPGWYGHLWESTDRTAIRWLTKVAHLLREHDLDASPAGVIEAVRLAETLAAMRGRPVPGLPELMEAAQAVLCFGGDAPIHLITEKLIVGDRLGSVPDETPQIPLQQDLQREQKRLRLPAQAVHRDHDFDLRQPIDLDRSRLLHRLLLLGIGWGQPQPSPARGSTFHERWRLQWRPEFAVELIEASRFGSSVAEAAAACAAEAADHAPGLPELTTLLDRVLLADLPAAAERVTQRVQAEATLAADTGLLMDALPPLSRIVRYGNVRQTQIATVGHVVDGLFARICIGLPGACSALNDEAAAAMLRRIVSVDSAVQLLQNNDHRAAWALVLTQLADQAGLHGLLAGRCCRLLHNQGLLSPEALAQRFGLALSPAVEPAQAAAWIEGLLSDSRALLIHDEALWRVLDAWVTGLPGEIFTTLLPLLRRTFGAFSAPERRQLGERVKRGRFAIASASPELDEFDAGRAAAVLPIVAQLLGLSVNGFQSE